MICDTNVDHSIEIRSKTDFKMSANEERTEDTQSTSDFSRNFPEATEQPDPHPYVPRYLSYRTEKIAGMFNKTKYRLNFYVDEDFLYWSNINTKLNEPVYVFTGKQQEGDESKMKLIPNKDRSTFVLINDDKEIFHSTMIRPEGLEHDEPKVIDAFWTPSELNSPPIHLISKIPDLEEDGTFTLDFEGRYAEVCNMNAIMIDKENDEVKMLIRKINDWEVDVAFDTLPDVPPLLIYALGLSLYLCPF